MYLVYKHTTPCGKVYIGITKQTAENRWKNGNGYKSSPHFWSAIQCYGWKNITHEILHDGLTAEDACEYERRYIEKYRATDRRYGYNQKTGGETGVKYSSEVCKKISRRKKLFYEAHPEERLKLSRRATGFHHSETAKEKMRLAKMGTHFLMTDEWKARIGEANRKRILSDDNLRKGIVARCRANGEKCAIKVEQLDMHGVVLARYDSMKAAGRATGIKDGNISKACSGKAKTAGGYRWQYAI